jgi:hypothetical protein
MMAVQQLQAHPDALTQILCLRCDQFFLQDQPTRYHAPRVGWVHVRCPAATEFSIAPGLGYGEATTWSAQPMPMPTSPQHPFGSPEMRILRAWIEAQEAHPGDTRAALAAVVTVIERYRHGRRLQLADTWTSLPDWLRAVTAKPEDERIKALLGGWSKSGEFVQAELVPERWRLTEEEARVYEWTLDGWALDAIQRELTAPRLRKHRELWVTAEKVQRLLDSAEAKVRGMFGVA